MIGVLALGACVKEVTAPRALRIVPGALPLPLGAFSAGGSFTSDGQHTNVGRPVTITAEVLDQAGNVVPGVAVSWRLAAGDGSIDVVTSFTDTSGTATAQWTLDTIARVDSIHASIASSASIVMTATGVHGPATAASKVSGDDQRVVPGAVSQPCVVKITDRYGNPVGGFAVAWESIGGGTVGALTTTTSADGTALMTFTTGAAPQNYTVVATFGAMPAATFTVIAVE